VEGSCGHGNEPSGSIKYWGIPQWLSDWRLLKRGLAPWSSLFNDTVNGSGCITSNDKDD
jgi:hypothetical protein